MSEAMYVWLTLITLGVDAIQHKTVVSYEGQPARLMCGNITGLNQLIWYKHHYTPGEPYTSIPTANKVAFFQQIVRLNWSKTDTQNDLKCRAYIEDGSLDLVIETTRLSDQHQYLCYTKPGSEVVPASGVVDLIVHELTVNNFNPLLLTSIFEGVVIIILIAVIVALICFFLRMHRQVKVSEGSTQVASVERRRKSSAGPRESRAPLIDNDDDVNNGGHYEEILIESLKKKKRDKKIPANLSIKVVEAGTDEPHGEDPGVGEESCATSPASTPHTPKVGEIWASVREMISRWNRPTEGSGDSFKRVRLTSKPDEQDGEPAYDTVAIEQVPQDGSIRDEAPSGGDHSTLVEESEPGQKQRENTIRVADEDEDNNVNHLKPVAKNQQRATNIYQKYFATEQPPESTEIQKVDETSTGSSYSTKASVDVNTIDRDNKLEDSDAKESLDSPRNCKQVVGDSYGPPPLGGAQRESAEHCYVNAEKRPKSFAGRGHNAENPYLDMSRGKRITIGCFGENNASGLGLLSESLTLGEDPEENPYETIRRGCDNRELNPKRDINNKNPTSVDAKRATGSGRDQDVLKNMRRRGVAAKAAKVHDEKTNSVPKSPTESLSREPVYVDMKEQENWNSWTVEC